MSITTLYEDHSNMKTYVCEYGYKEKVSIYGTCIGYPIYKDLTIAAASPTS